MTPVALAGAFLLRGARATHRQRIAGGDGWPGTCPSKRSTSPARAAAFGQAACLGHRWTPPEREALEAAQRAIWQARAIVLNDLDKPTRRQGKWAGLDVRICTSKAVKTPERELFLSANAKRAKARERAELLAALRAGLAERAT